MLIFPDKTLISLGYDDNSLITVGLESSISEACNIGFIENNDLIGNQQKDVDYNIIHINGEIKKSSIKNNNLKSNNSSTKYGLFYIHLLNTF